MKRRFIGWGSRTVGAVPVGRAQDLAKPVPGKIYLPDPVNSPTLLRGVGTNFEEFTVGGLIILPKVGNASASSEIAEIKGPEEIVLKKPFKGKTPVKQLTGRDDVTEEGGFENTEVKGTKDDFEGSNFKYAPKVDQTQTYARVFDRLRHGGAIAIFPEGGSHDRTELLPLKAGVAIMALGALAQDPDCGLTIVPCGMNYFHAHKFRSRAVVEFGNPLEVPPELVELYRNGNKRDSVGPLLDIIYQSLLAVTLTSPDYDTLMLIQAVRRLYNPMGKKMPLPMVVELNRRLVKGYTHYKDHPRIIALKQSVLDYNKQLRYLNIKDHQVEYARFSLPKALLILLYRLLKISVLSIGVLPGLILFAPVFIASKVISIKKSREALANSSVKLQGRDVIATWKLLVALAFAPVLYNFYTIGLAIWTYYNRVQGIVPDWVPVLSIIPAGWIFFPAITFAALRFGEVGMDILKSLRPLILSLNPAGSNQIHKLRMTRAELANEVTDVINTLGPEMFPDFDHARLVPDHKYERPGSPESSRRPRSSDSAAHSPSSGSGESTPNRRPSWASAAGMGGGSSANGYIPRSESLANLGNIGIFASHPGSRSRSPSREDGGAAGEIEVSDFGAALGSQEGFDAVSAKIRGAMRERGEERQRRASRVAGEEELMDEEGEEVLGEDRKGV